MPEDQKNPADSQGTADVVGWREWVSLPDLGVDRIKAKVDTGARTSSLHAADIETVERDGAIWAQFMVHPLQRSTRERISVKARLVEERTVRSSNGSEEVRPIILTPMVIAGEPRSIELSLTSRDIMGFRLLLGREALRGRYLVDPARSFVLTSEKRRKVAR